MTRFRKITSEFCVKKLYDHNLLDFASIFKKQSDYLRHQMLANNV